jgi:hypothetical protein
MLPIPTGPITERNEFSAGLLLKAHKIGAAFCCVWLRLNWIMFWAWGRVKIQASALCPKCNAHQTFESRANRKSYSGRLLLARRAREAGAFRQYIEGAFMSAFKEHHDELVHSEQRFGRDRGRLAVSLDRITNALVLVGQHGVYCTSQRNPTVPAMDLRMVTQELTHAKELIQSVMEELRKARGSA